jgi:predicted AAA+ superfamily ATPase
MLKRFYVSLLERPGQEVNFQKVASEIGVSVQQIEKYLPLLEMTDLVYHITKFRSSPLRVRRGLMKFYLVDLALRNATLRLTDSLLGDENMLGLYAENLVFLALKKWRGAIQIDYYRERQGEVDFVVHTGPNDHLPIEVKYQNDLKSSDLASIRKFSLKHRVTSQPIVVTKKWGDFGNRDTAFMLPLPLFLILFD